MEVCCSETPPCCDVSLSLHHPLLGIRQLVVALLRCARGVFSPLPLFGRSAPASWGRRGVDTLQLGCEGDGGTRTQRLRLTGPCPLEQGR